MRSGNSIRKKSVSPAGSITPPSVAPKGSCDVAENDLAAARREAARRIAQAQRAAEEAAAREAAILEAVVANLPEMVAIPSGTYRMGCVSGRSCDATERPVHEVRVSSFALSRHEVTSRSGTCAWSTVLVNGRATKAGAVATVLSSM